MRRKRAARWFRWTLTLLAVGGGIAYGSWQLQNLPDPPPAYRFSQVKRGTLAQVVTTSGPLSPVMKVEVGSQISGTILRVFVDDDANVRAGHMLAQIDPATYEPDLA